MFYLKNLILLAILFQSMIGLAQLTPQSKGRSTASISDSIDILHCAISINITDFSGQTISGNTAIQFVAKVDGITYLPLDLLALLVDSVKTPDGTTIFFTQLEDQLLITLPSIYNTADTGNLIVFYNGSPENDSFFGGWYWTSDHAYQLGIGIDANPHNFGRAWFPCFDNFVERSTITCSITTPANYKAFCGGVLQDEITNGDGTKTWIWHCAQQIPSYLVSVAVSTYATVYQTYAGLERDIPIELGVKPSDSIDLKNSFIHLTDALSTFENHFGAYSWDRVGYVVIPFGGGAMEHAMNIAYPAFAITGSTEWETLMAHELSHQWWGNLVTCSTAEEMWINEGMAVFSEHLFLEELYGEEVYKNTVRNNHLNVIHYGFARDGGNYFPLSGVPQDFTYGSTTYNKGADVAHTLRGYLGDELFFSCSAQFLEAFQFKAVSSADYRDFLTSCSGISLNAFFNDWIYNPGFPGFEIEEISRNDEGEVVTVCIEQKLNHAPNFYTNVPLTISFFNQNWEIMHEEKIIVNGQHQSYTISAPTPLNGNVILDYHEKINDAVTSDLLVAKTTGLYQLDHALMDITINSISDSAIIYAQHYWVGADGLRNSIDGLHTNTQRYWSIKGILPSGFQASAKFVFNGKLSTSGGYLDHEFISNSDDSLVLLYKSNHADDWSIYPYFTLNTYGNTFDKFGAFELDTLLLGEYTIGMYNISISPQQLDTLADCNSALTINQQQKVFFSIYPNPAHSFLTVHINELTSPYAVTIYSMMGKKIAQLPVSNQITQTFSIESLPQGSYQIQCTSVDNRIIASQNLIIIR